MSHAALAARIVEALEAAAAREATGAALVSVALEVLRSAEPAAVETQLARKTRTLMFLTAEAMSAQGEHIATSSAVFKLKP
jgi:hypothetical protein